jgi:hypothetical protein
LYPSYTSSLLVAIYGKSNHLKGRPILEIIKIKQRRIMKSFIGLSVIVAVASSAHLLKKEEEKKDILADEQTEIKAESFATYQNGSSGLGSSYRPVAPVAPAASSRSSP